jgi:CheY-like chemotaxis protein
MGSRLRPSSKNMRSRLSFGNANGPLVSDGPNRADRLIVELGTIMTPSSLTGRSILVVEDEPLIALDVAQAFQNAGARVMMARTLKDAMAVINSQNLSAAILDHALGNEDSDELCERLKALSVPFINYTGLSALADHCADAPHVSKPAPPAELVRKVAELLH